ncbi:MAG: ribbon-helix-helix domain-containing protein [Vicinamibacterales bacterium]|nr:ribbon-helix-helix domain-containing protein [Vicinamibacterales bacterium]
MKGDHANGMKTVSIPDDVFERAERFAKQAKRSQNEVLSAAVREYIARHAPDDVTEAMNCVCESGQKEPDAFSGAAARQVLERTEW